MESTSDPSRGPSAARSHLERGFRFEQAGTLDRALESYREALIAGASPLEQAEAHLRIARVHRTRAEWDLSRAESTEAVRLATESGDQDLAAEALNVEIGALQHQGRYEESDALGQQAIDLARSPRVRGITLQNLGRGAAERGDFARSDAFFANSIEAFRAANYEIGLAIALVNAAKSALDQGRADRSVEIGREAIAVARRLNALDVLLSAVQNQAAAFVALHEVESAELLLTEALGHFTSARNPVRQAECLEVMGQMSELKNDAETAARCYTRANDLATQAGDLPLIGRLTTRLALLEGGAGASTKPKDS